MTIEYAKQLSPLRKSTQATSIPALAREQLEHFSIDPNTKLGQQLTSLTEHIYAANIDMHELWATTLDVLPQLDRQDRIAWFNAKRFVCFQLAKVLDSLQNPMRKNYQSLTNCRTSTVLAKGPYPVFDNVTAIFSATPVIARTATYLYACTEWVDDAFHGRELLHEIYSRLLNPTSISLANYIVDIEAGTRADEYFAWNFNSGMAAIDAILSHVVGYQDIVLSSRNVYGGTYQLLHDWYGKQSNLDVAVRWFDGYTVDAFQTRLAQVREECADRLAAGRHIYIFIESPCNPHGYVLDVPGICQAAHEQGFTVICDSTVGTPMLQPVLQREEPIERPDFVMHSYTKDLAGTGTVTAGVVIARNERMFIPKGESVTAPGPDGQMQTFNWDETLFWNVYYVKGAFLDADKAFDVITGMRTLELRMLQKCINTLVLARVLAKHPDIDVKCSAVDGNENASLLKQRMFLGLPAPLFTIAFERPSDGKPVCDRDHFKRFFDCLEPAFGMQVSLGQVNTVVLCPAMTSHSEMSEEALQEAGISPTTIRVSVGDEDPRTLLAHFIRTAKLMLDPGAPGFSQQFPAADEIDALYNEIYIDVHTRYINNKPSMQSLME